MIISIYALVAFLDVVVVGLFFGPALGGVSLRWISGFDDFLPLCALSLLWISFGLLFALASRTIRVRLLGRNSSILCVAVIMVYIIVAGFSFGSMALGDL